MRLIPGVEGKGKGMEKCKLCDGPMDSSWVRKWVVEEYGARWVVGVRGEGTVWWKKMGGWRGEFEEKEEAVKWVKRRVEELD